MRTNGAEHVFVCSSSIHLIKICLEIAEPNSKEGQRIIYLRGTISGIYSALHIFYSNL